MPMPLERPACTCFQSASDSVIHTEPQDLESDAWHQLLELIDRAVATGATEFAPGPALGWQTWWQIVTLPPSIGRLTSVRKLMLYGSNLDQLPPEIGEMESLEELDLYTSYRLHWLPYEVTRCPNLKSSCISTRALYGNYKQRHPFPRLQDGPDFLPEVTPRQCSVCRSPLASTIMRRWISLNIATDVVPLLVHACSKNCLDSLPTPPSNYVRHPHTGGTHLQQPQRGRM
ncbi:leucine-rich repeat domain-containing protein [Bremerella cremea]|uniref:leucine-rich repeat domain-containing protein n=1 Tax=Bremerella cremea TaxID=1031537 RepID=UPI0031EB3921